MKKEHIHNWIAISYFYTEDTKQKDGEYLVLECTECSKIRVLEGENTRDND